MKWELSSELAQMLPSETRLNHWEGLAAPSQNSLFESAFSWPAWERGLSAKARSSRTWRLLKSWLTVKTLSVTHAKFNSLARYRCTEVHWVQTLRAHNTRKNSDFFRKSQNIRKASHIVFRSVQTCHSLGKNFSLGIGIEITLHFVFYMLLSHTMTVLIYTWQYFTSTE